MRIKVLEMKQPVISEMRSYDRPPTIVKQVIEATFLLLGESFQAINSWQKMQALLGKLGRESVKHRIGRLRPNDLADEQCRRAEEILNGIEIEEAEKTSSGVTIFFAWCIVTLAAKSV